MVFPNSTYYKRGAFKFQDIVKYAGTKDFTDVIVVNENRKKPSIDSHIINYSRSDAMLIVHLPNGPTAHFKLTGIKPSKEIEVYVHLQH